MGSVETHRAPQSGLKCIWDPKNIKDDCLPFNHSIYSSKLVSKTIVEHILAMFI